MHCQVIDGCSTVRTEVLWPRAFLRIENCNDIARAGAGFVANLDDAMAGGNRGDNRM